MGRIVREERNPQSPVSSLLKPEQLPPSYSLVSPLLAPAFLLPVVYDTGTAAPPYIPVQLPLV